MKAICLFFQIHQPLRHRKYHFFDIGNDHYYYDDYANESALRNIAAKSYLPANAVLLELITKLKGAFKVSFSMSGIAMEQFELYAPEVIESFRRLADTGCVEFISETYSHSLASLKDKDIFKEQVKLHQQKLWDLFGYRPQIFRNTEMIYSDEIGEQVAEMGYQAMLTEGAKHILGWKSPNYLYVNARNPRLKMLLRNFKFSDDISFRFSDTNWTHYPLTAEKFIHWLEKTDRKEELLNLFLSYESLGDRQSSETGIFEFLKKLVLEISQNSHFRFSTPTEVIQELQPVSAVQVPSAVSWADEERDLTAWLGNKMQKEAFEKLYRLRDQMKRCQDATLQKDWNYLQASDHFYYMSTKYFTDGQVHRHLNPFSTPYDAFINYMNVLSDFKVRVNSVVPKRKVENQIAALHHLIDKKDEKIKKLEATIRELEKRPGKKSITFPKH